MISTGFPCNENNVKLRSVDSTTSELCVDLSEIVDLNLDRELHELYWYEDEAFFYVFYKLDCSNLFLLRKIERNCASVHQLVPQDLCGSSDLSPPRRAGRCRRLAAVVTCCRADG